MILRQIRFILNRIREVPRGGENIRLARKYLC